MDPTTAFMVYRILIVSGGILSIYLGYRLFAIVQTKQGDFRIKTGQNLEIRLSDVAPGVFFALFGASVLAFSLINGITIRFAEPNYPASQRPASASNAPAPAASAERARNSPTCISQRPGACGPSQ
jgi:hypothetical protein